MLAYVCRSNKYMSRKEIQRQLQKTNKQIVDVNRALIDASDDVVTLKGQVMALLMEISSAELSAIQKNHPVIGDLDKMDTGKSCGNLDGDERVEEHAVCYYDSMYALVHVKHCNVEPNEKKLQNSRNGTSCALG